VDIISVETKAGVRLASQLVASCLKALWSVMPFFAALIGGFFLISFICGVLTLVASSIGGVVLTLDTLYGISLSAGFLIGLLVFFMVLEKDEIKKSYAAHKNQVYDEKLAKLRPTETKGGLTEAGCADGSITMIERGTLDMYHPRDY